VRQTSGTSTARQYAGTMAGFWSGLSRTLRTLDAIAADPQRLDEDALAPLRALQYRLHHSAELLAGVEPPVGSRAGHHELRDSLVDARDATAEMVDAIEDGGNEAACELLFEWRGALFRVRLARLRLGEQPEPRAEPESKPYSAAAASGLAVLGAIAFVAGAVLVLWPLWAAGIALVAGGLLVHRPERPTTRRPERPPTRRPVRP
jgi:hypothetical protein